MFLNITTKRFWSDTLHCTVCCLSEKIHFPISSPLLESDICFCISVIKCNWGYCMCLLCSALYRFPFYIYIYIYISARLVGLFSWVQCRNMLSLGADSMWIIHYVSFVKVQSHGTKYVFHLGELSYGRHIFEHCSSVCCAIACDKHADTYSSLNPIFPTPTIGSSLTLTRPWLTANSSERRLHQSSLKCDEECARVNRVLT